MMRRRELLSIAAGLAGSSCATVQGQGEGPLLVAPQPLRVPGVRDGRAPFREAFERERRGLSGRRRERAPADARFAARAPHTAVLVVPGLLGDCVAAQAVPFGDGVLRTPQRSATEAYEGYADLSLHSMRLVLLPGRASAVANGRTLAAVVRETAAQRGVRHLVVVGYSKGTVDALHALAELDQARAWPPALEALVSVAGIVRGTPLADRHGPLFEALSAHFAPLDCSPEQGGSVASLTQAERRAWLAANALPRRLRTYSVVAHADPQRIAWPLRPGYEELSAVDARNDGQVLADDALLPGSTLLAEAAADHWALALPLERSTQGWLRALGAQPYPREALFRALLRTVVADG